jgi:deazaflavin-dependent oxidoreductase (nitroreductase family)
MSERSMEADLVSWGKVIRLQTIGRRSGSPRVVTIGFIAAGGDTLLVAASAETTGWAANLRAHRDCRVELDGEQRPYVATELDEDERADAVRELILKYGTPAERLGAGPAFRLDPLP